MYKVDDLIMYGSTGVCRVQAIGTPEFYKDSGKDYYFLEPLYQSGMIYAPVDNDKVFMRPVISKEMVDSLIDSMPSVESEVYKSNSIQQLSKHYQSVIDTHDCMDLIKLTKSIYKKNEEAIRMNRHLGQIDKRFLKRAQDLLYGEFAAVLGLPIESVEDYISERISGKGA